MTMFRVGPAGIPASLKTDMNAVLNKKFGTTGQNYPPAGWPDDVNFLGLLPVKTASGAVAAFSDGADTVPLKSLNCQIVPVQPGSGDPSPSNVRPISGSLQLVLYHTGTNIWNEQTELGGLNTTTGEENSLTDIIRNVGYISVKPNTQYYFYNGTDIASQSNVNIVVLCYDENKQYTGSYYYRNKTQPILSNPENSYFIRFYCVSTYGTTYKNDISINYPATDTSLHDYSGESKSFAFASEIYGGSLNAFAGELSDEWEIVTYTGANNENWFMSQTGGTYRFYIANNNIKQPTGSRGFVYSNIGKYAESGNAEGACFTYWNGTSVTVFYVPPQTITTVEAFKEWLSTNNLQICFERATAIETEINPIDMDSFYSSNNIWNTSGDTECEYYADIDLALQAVSSSRGLMMASRPVTQLVGEESDPDQVNELVENDETEQEGEDDAR